jgi:4-aminobutyrate aminotransferase-like enzyme
MESVIEKRQRLLGAATLFYEQPVQIVRGKGVLLYDQTGKEYIDMYNNVPCVGHANPRVVEAMSKQMSTLNVHSRYLHEGILEYAERLLALHHDGIESAVFACSGTEASEVALIMARAATGGRGIICSDATYHGNSTEVIKMTLASRANTSTDSDFRAIPYPQKLRPLISGLDDESLCQLYLDEVKAAIDDFKQQEIPFAGMFMCSIMANEGLPDIPGRFMALATDLVHAAGGLMIADEVQAGYCRSGEWWGYEKTGFQPDIVTMGKPMGNGLPLSAVVSSHSSVAAFRKRSHYFNTFASSPLQASVGIAVLDEIEQQNLRESSAAVGQHLRNELEGLVAGHDAIAEVRGCGLFAGIEWVDAEGEADAQGAARVSNLMKDRGFLLSNAGSQDNVIKLRPPLVFKQTHADRFLSAFQTMLKEY